MNSTFVGADGTIVYGTLSEDGEFIPLDHPTATANPDRTVVVISVDQDTGTVTFA